MFELRRRATAPLAVAAAVTVSVALMQVGPLSSGETALAAATLGAGGEYHPVTPARVFDSRSGATPSTAPEGRELTVPVVGLGG
ncbi:MAG: hypothetical protein ACPGSH_05610, partial [Ilumatobacteraceae bacterium]